MPLAFDRYYDNDQLEAALAELADAHPRLVERASLGRSHEGREIALLILTNRDTGPHREKPALWVDGNIHATELTACMAALYLAQHLLARYGQDAQATRILDEQAVYIVPRLNPDGAAAVFAAEPRFLRSGTRPYPYEDKREGLHAEDVDGDGRILQMRLPDPAGDWKVSDRDPRLMVKRQPDEEGGSYYRLLPEGRIEHFDGHLIKLAPPLAGLDFNRNFPHAWRPEGEQRGAGDYPGSEPEIQAVLRFMAEQPNIFGAITFHTYSRAILRPSSSKPDDEMDTHDLWVYQAIGERGTELTGYPNVSVYHHFRYHPKEVITGVFDDWLYAHKGIFAFTVELWDLATAAGIAGKNDEKRFIEWFRKHPLEDDHRILDFVLAQAPEALVPWRSFEHPELGPLEIGGWDSLYSWRNPPPALLEAEIAPQAAFVLSFASLAPRLAWREVAVEAVGSETWHLTAVVENLGFLGTHVSKQAKTAQAVRPARIELALPEGAMLLSGKLSEELGHLEGRSNKLSVAYYGSSPTDNRAKAEWLIRAPVGATIELTAIAERAGTIRRSVSLGP